MKQKYGIFFEAVVIALLMILTTTTSTVTLGMSTTNMEESVTASSTTSSYDCGDMVIKGDASHPTEFAVYPHANYNNVDVGYGDGVTLYADYYLLSSSDRDKQEFTISCYASTMQNPLATKTVSFTADGNVEHKGIVSISLDMEVGFTYTVRLTAKWTDRGLWPWDQDKDIPGSPKTDSLQFTTGRPAGTATFPSGIQASGRWSSGNVAKGGFEIKNAGGVGSEIKCQVESLGGTWDSISINPTSFTLVNTGSSNLQTISLSIYVKKPNTEYTGTLRVTVTKGSGGGSVSVTAHVIKSKTFDTTNPIDLLIENKQSFYPMLSNFLAKLFDKNPIILRMFRNIT